MDGTREPPPGSMCALAGCPVEHLHPITGSPPDYHWRGKDGPAPRWRNVYKKAPDKEDWWYSPKEVAAVVGCTVATVWANVRRGELKHSRFPGGWLIRIQGRDIDAWIRGGSRHA